MNTNLLMNANTKFTAISTLVTISKLVDATLNRKSFLCLTQ